MFSHKHTHTHTYIYIHTHTKSDKEQNVGINSKINIVIPIRPLSTSIKAHKNTVEITQIRSNLINQKVTGFVQLVICINNQDASRLIRATYKCVLSVHRSCVYSWFLSDCFNAYFFHCLLIPILVRLSLKHLCRSFMLCRMYVENKIISSNRWLFMTGIHCSRFDCFVDRNFNISCIIDCFI